MTDKNAKALMSWFFLFGIMAFGWGTALFIYYDLKVFAIASGLSCAFFLMLGTTNGET